MGACGKKDSQNIMEDDPSLTTELETEGGSVESGDGYGFDIFQLDMKTTSGETVLISYDVSGKSDAQYEDSSEDIHLKGAEAMDKASQLFTVIRIDKDTPEDQVIQKILEQFNVDEYAEFKLAVNFDEGTTLRIDE